MRIGDLLDQKGRGATKVGPSQTISTVFTTLAEHKIGALVVCDSDDSILGIISERDLVRVIAKDGERVLSWPVDSVMTKNVTTCSEEDTVHSVMETMTNARFRHMPITKDNKLIGVVSIGDMVKAHIESLEREAENIKAYIHT